MNDKPAQIESLLSSRISGVVVVNIKYLLAAPPSNSVGVDPSHQG